MTYTPYVFPPSEKFDYHNHHANSIVLQWVRNTLPKQGFTTTKKREKFLFDVDDLVNVIVCAWTKDDSVFIHECMRVQMTFLILIYCFSGARIGAFLHNGKTEVEKGEGQTERVVFEGLVWKVRQQSSAG